MRRFPHLIRPLLCGIALAASGSPVWSNQLAAPGSPAVMLPLTGPRCLKASNTGAGDYFGGAVAIDGNTLVVGAPHEKGSQVGVNPPSDDLAQDAGAVYVFVKNDCVWVQQAYLKASNAEAHDHFGYSVAVSGETIVVDAYGEDGSGTGANPPSNNDADSAGAAYVFVRRNGIWTQQAYLKASSAVANDAFGVSTNGYWFLARNLVNGAFTYTPGHWNPGWTIMTRASVR